jgi:protein SCO1
MYAEPLAAIAACPITLARMQALEQAFERPQLDARFVMVTLDPRHDTPERLANYGAQHKLSARWTLAVGSVEHTIALSRLLAVQRIQDDDHILHEVRIVVVSADGQRMRVFEGWNFDDMAALGAR